MTEWRQATEEAPEGFVVAVLNMHWKKRGWLSCSLDFGEVHHHPDGHWWVENNDDRGGGGENWAPYDEEKHHLEGFTHWIHVCDLPALPEDINEKAF